MRSLFLLLAGLSVALAFGAAPAGAQLPPTRVFGAVTVDGRPAPAGTVVQAFIGEKLCGEGVVRRISDELPLGYVVDVAGASQSEGCGTDGATITFRVGGVPANETATFATGSFVRLDLTVSGQVATPTPGAPTPPPFGAESTTTPTIAASPETGAPPATAGPSPAATEATATATAPAEPGLPVRTATPAGSTGESSGGGGTRLALAVVAALAVLAAAGAGAYLWYRWRA